jgi:D-sedoheptulose 7-phosphate isomerase
MNLVYAEGRVQETRDLLANKKSFPLDLITELAVTINQIFDQGGKIAFVGNGGSASEAMHIAAEFTGKCIIDHIPLPALCLNESQSSLTAIANDYGVSQMFARMVKAHMKQGDLLIALSTSGKSENIINALMEATTLGVDSVLWMGDFPKPKVSSSIWQVPSTSTPQIQEIHLMWGHLVAELVERSLNQNKTINA